MIFDEIIKQSPTYLAILAGCALVLLGFLSPDEFFGIKVRWTRFKSIGCLLLGLIVLSYVVVPWATNTVVVSRTTLSNMRTEIDNARSGDIKFCIDHNGAVMREIDSLLKTAGPTK